MFCMDILSAAGKSDKALHRQGRPVPLHARPWQPVPPHSWNLSDCDRALNERRGIIMITTCLYYPLPGPGSPETASRARPAAPPAPGPHCPAAPTGPLVASSMITQEHA